MTELLGEGFQLLTLGMGSVFIFLALLVFLVSQMSRMVQWIESHRPTPPSVDDFAPKTVSDPELLAVISAAIHKYRSS